MWISLKKKLYKTNIQIFINIYLYISQRLCLLISPIVRALLRALRTWMWIFKNLSIRTYVFTHYCDFAEQYFNAKNYIYMHDLWCVYPSIYVVKKKVSQLNRQKSRLQLLFYYIFNIYEIDMQYMQAKLNGMGVRSLNVSVTIVINCSSHH